MRAASDDFRQFLNNAKQKQVLPPWWDPKIDKKGVERMALDESSWPSIAHAVEKGDVNEHYGQPFAAMTLRVRADCQRQAEARSSWQNASWVRFDRRGRQRVALSFRGCRCS